MSPIASAPRAPYALEPTSFSFPALAAMAGRAALGGPRELALACFLVARLVRDAALGGEALSAEQLGLRAQAAKHWLGSAAIPAATKTALSRLVDTTTGAGPEVIKPALDAVIAVTANQLEPSARLELGRLTQAIAG